MKKLAGLLIVLVLAGVGASRAYDYWDYQVNSPVSAVSQRVNVTVATGESPDAVGRDLQAKGLIHSAEVWNWYLKFSGRRGAIQAGSFVLDRHMTMPEIVDALEHGRADQTAVRTQEGIPTKFVAQALEQAGFAKAADYLAAEKDPAWAAQYTFLASKPKSRDLEGYLFPDTYSLDRGATAKDLVKAQLDAFDRVFAPDWRTAIQQPTAARPAESIDSIVILASIVDREVNRDEERARACGVFYNRLKLGIPLGVDATILYALGVLKKDLTQDDLAINSPYNTRKNAGLPPGPISNPGAAAIKGCVFPENNDYLFYFTDRNGTTHFEKNETDFYNDINKYGVSGG